MPMARKRRRLTDQFKPIDGNIDRHGLRVWLAWWRHAVKAVKAEFPDVGEIFARAHQMKR
jgi:hypothetical protein